MEAIVSAVAFLALGAFLLAASVTDIRERRIPNRLVASVVVFWLVWRLALVTMTDDKGTCLLSSVIASFAAAIAFAMALLAITAIAERLTGKFMMGGGDIKLLAAISLYLGIKGMLIALFAACVVSLLYAAAHLKRGIPFAPCIMCGTLFASLLV